MVYDEVIGKCLEWNLPIWYASLDLKKAFDRIEYSSLFTALEIQGVSNEYLRILSLIYYDQSG